MESGEEVLGDVNGRLETRSANVGHVAGLGRIEQSRFVCSSRLQEKEGVLERKSQTIRTFW